MHFLRVFVCYFGFPGSLRVAWGLGISVLYRVGYIGIIYKEEVGMLTLLQYIELTCDIPVILKLVGTIKS